MPQTVVHDPNDRMVIVRVYGTASHADHFAARAEALRLCQENDCSKILVDLRDLLTTQSSTMDCFDFGESLAKTLPRIRIAHVLPTHTQSKADVRFTSTVGANRGVRTGEFDSVEEARRWLLETPQAGPP